MAASSRTLFLSLSTRPGVQNAETARCRKEKFFAPRCRVARSPGGTGAENARDIIIGPEVDDRWSLKG